MRKHHLFYIDVLVFNYVFTLAQEKQIEVTDILNQGAFRKRRNGLHLRSIRIMENSISVLNMC